MDEPTIPPAMSPLPKDPAGERFPDFHHDRLKTLEERVVALEPLQLRMITLNERLDAMETGLAMANRRIDELVDSNTKQRAVNKALLGYFVQGLSPFARR